MHEEADLVNATYDRRKLLIGAAAGVAGAGAIGSLVAAGAAGATNDRRAHSPKHQMSKIPAPKPIPHGADLQRRPNPVLRAAA